MSRRLDKQDSPLPQPGNVWRRRCSCHGATLAHRLLRGLRVDVAVNSAARVKALPRCPGRTRRIEEDPGATAGNCRTAIVPQTLKQACRSRMSIDLLNPGFIAAIKTIEATKIIARVVEFCDQPPSLSRHEINTRLVGRWLSFCGFYVMKSAVQHQVMSFSATQQFARIKHSTHTHTQLFQQTSSSLALGVRLWSSLIPLLCWH